LRKGLRPCQRLTGPRILGTLAWRKSRAVGACKTLNSKLKNKMRKRIESYLFFPSFPYVGTWVLRIPGFLIRPRIYGHLLAHSTLFLQAGYTLGCIPMGFSLRDPFLNKGRRHHTLEVFVFLKTLRMNGNGSFQKRCQGSLFRIE